VCRIIDIRNDDYQECAGYLGYSVTDGTLRGLGVKIEDLGKGDFHSTHLM
jgi:hypothetical protein